MYRYDVNGDLETRIDPTRAPSMPAVTYKYDALGRRVARIKGSEWTRYTYDGDDVVLDENSNGSLVYYGNGPGIDNKLWYQQGSSNPVFFLTDHLGSTRALVSSTGSIIGTMDYDSFGKPLGQIATRYQYAGREWDPDTELYYYRARWYDPQARRFISEDPIGLNGGINLYAYVGNNAVNLVDPLGLWSPGAHDEIIRHGLGNMFSSQDLMKVQSYGRAFDKATQDTPFLHSMRAKGQSIEDANKDKAKFVRDALNRARQAERDSGNWTGG